MRAVAVVGMGCELPGASGPAELWQLLIDGRDMVGAARAETGMRQAGHVDPARWTTGFDAASFGLDPCDAERIDPQQRLLLAVTRAACADAGIEEGTLAGTRTAVFAGQSGSDHWDGRAGRDDLDLRDYAGSQQRGLTAGRLSYVFDLRGPSVTVDAAQASSLNVQVDASGADPDGLLDEFLAAVGEGVGVAARTVERRRLPWLLATQWAGFADRPSGKRIKGKSGMHRGALSEQAAAAIFTNLTRADYAHPGSGILIAPYGGQVNAVRPGATAAPHRDCAITLLFVSEWTDPAEDDRHVAFQRDLYLGVYAETGGVPVPGACVNYPDVDLLDPALNRSGVPWSQLYFRDAYPVLRRVKARWDPANVFRHRMSIAP